MSAVERLFFTFRSITKGDHDFDGIADEAAAELAAKDAEIARLKAENKNMCEIFKRIEFVTDMHEEESCPSCLAVKPSHYEDCELAAALQEAQ